MSDTPTGFSALPTSSGASSASDSNSSLTNRTTVVILSSVLSVVGIVAVAGLVFICCRYRQRRGGSFFPRGISPIDDDEIETWKGARGLPEAEASENEKGPSGLFGVSTGGNNDLDSPPLLSAGALGAGATVQRRDQSRPRAESYPDRCASLDSSAIFNGGAAALDAKPLPPPKKTPSNVIIYKDPPQPYPGPPGSASSTTGFPPIPGMSVPPAATAAGAAAINYLQQQQQNVPLYRRSEEFSPRSTRSMSFGYPASRGMAGRFSFDQDREYLFSQALTSPSTPPTALQHARAPNSRAGLTDETVPGDPSFLPTPKRLPSRLLKMPPATGSPSATAAATAASATGGAGIIFPPRRNSHSASGSSNIPSPSGNSSTASNSNSAAYWHARTRSARSCSTVSYAGSEVPLNQSFGQMSHQRRPSVVQYQSMYRPQALTPPQQSPTSILHKQLPVPPLPVSTRPSLNNGGSENISRHSSHSMYHEYLHQEKQPREASSSSTLASASSASSSSVPPRVFSGGGTEAAGASDDSDGPLLGGLSPPRPHMADSPPIVHERRSSSLQHLGTIGRAIG
ncbi:hypothetical protein Sste5346_008458 [Sporothrix stenoceras]|uniref:Uncharacterized protein n=1 Tax=Sporothrix stenoceras TaxID=5173 RepID=A0ABR3YQA7_9PEZI